MLIRFGGLLRPLQFFEEVAALGVPEGVGRLNSQRRVQFRECFRPAVGFGELLGAFDALLSLQPVVHRPAPLRPGIWTILSVLSDKGKGIWKCVAGRFTSGGARSGPADRSAVRQTRRG